MALILDASYALAIAFDEPTVKVTPPLVVRIAREGAIVPSLWL